MSTQEQSEFAAQELGVLRWVQLSFLIGGAVMFWLFQNIITSVWDRFDEPQQGVVMVGAFVLAIITTVSLYRHPGTNGFTTEVAGELGRVHWPTRPETWNQTVVVVIFSVVAAVLLGVMDYMWNYLSDMVYGGGASLLDGGGK